MSHTHLKLDTCKIHSDATCDQLFYISVLCDINNAMLLIETLARLFHHAQAGQ
jgi:hypothetical protein